MKSSIKITVKETDGTGSFPVTRKYTFEQDNTLENIEEWIEVFKQILHAQTFPHGLIEKIFVHDMIYPRS